MVPSQTTLGRLVADRGVDSGSEPAVFFEDEVISYAELADSVRSVASGFLAAGLRPGDRVGLLLPNTPDFLRAWLGAAAAGLVTVPINPAYKPDEIRYILSDSAAAGLVTVEGRVGDVESVSVQLPELSARFVTDGHARGWTPFADLSGDTDADWPPDAGPGDPAAIIYTSGTTGRPKGVVLSHRNYLFDTWSLVTHIGATASDRFLCFLPLYHVNAQVVSVLSAFYVGGALALLREFKPQTFFENVARYRATTFSAVPTVYAILNTLPDVERYDLSSLRYCVCGAAPMPVEVFNTFEETFGAKICEGYGLSEATCGNCVNPLGEGAQRKIGSIGVPLPGQRMAILDDEGREQPDETVGEIVVGGDALMQGYFNNPKATSAAFTGDWLRTGDLGYRDADGFYFIVGRKKEMIIRGGVNIYPKEIEEVLYRHPSVQEAAVVGLPDDVWGETVCACVVPKPGAGVSDEELVSLCAEHLADYKVPERVERFDAFPKTPTGKIQKNEIVPLVLARRT